MRSLIRVLIAAAVFSASIASAEISAPAEHQEYNEIREVVQVEKALKLEINTNQVKLTPGQYKENLPMQLDRQIKRVRKL